MTAINSNRAIRGPVTAVPVVAGKGVRLVADTENNRWVVEADETVLFENLDGAINPTLVESPMNFERLKIYFGTSRIGSVGVNVGISFTEVLTDTLIGGRQGSPSNGWITLCGFFNGNNTTQGTPYMTFGQYSGCNTTTWTREAGGTLFRVTDQNVQSNSGWQFIYKIVGVNRIASN